jgi:tetratricopeptide (TPR) repeat protein
VTSEQARQSVLLAQGQARLTRAEMAIEQGDGDAALGYLTGFADDYESEPELVRVGLGKQVEAMLAADRLEDATTIAENLMESYPDFAAGLIDSVLLSIERDLGDLEQRLLMPGLPTRERERLEQKKQQLASAAQPLGKLLLNWAIHEQLSKLDLVPYRLTYANACRLSGDYDEALLQLEKVSELEEVASELGVLHNLGETHFAKATQGGSVDKDGLIKAVGYFDKIINGTSRGEDNQFPSEWWNAWSRRLQASDMLDQHAEEIPLRVEKLRLTAGQGLGGEPYRSRLQRLALKHQ